MPSYVVELISSEEKDKLFHEFSKLDLYEKKSSINGTCIKFFTDQENFKEMWEDNFEPMPNWIRPHVRIFSISSEKFSVKFEPQTKTVFVLGCDYYGWVKSIALGLVADFFEDFPSEHQRHSIHGSFIDKAGRGLALIGPSGSGKTTLTYGLLLDDRCNFLTDDWLFVRFANSDVLVSSSEKNSYIRCNLTEIWPQFSSKLKNLKKDSKDRAIIDVRMVLGEEKIRNDSVLSKIVLLTRDRKLPPFVKLTSKAALEFMIKNDFCNPHQLVRSKSKIQKRKEFFRELFEHVPVYLLNTIETPKKSLERLKKLL